MNKSKFVIDGRIEGKPESKYLRKKKTQNLKRLQGTLWVVVVSCAVFALLSFILFLEIQSLNSEIKQMNQTVASAGKVIKENQSQLAQIDSLQKSILKLKSENATLLENSNVTNGVYFEVQIGNYSNFNLDEYKDEMVGMHQDKTSKNARLCLGRFRSFQKAVLFESEIKKLGFSQAFVVGRINGNLVDYQEALKMVQQNNLK